MFGLLRGKLKERVDQPRKQMHCANCETEWFSEEAKCFLCGRFGSRGRYPTVRMGGTAPGRTLGEILD